MKKGISLIVLVITIVVMIILVAAVVITLNNNGVINQAGDAVKMTNTKQIEQAVTLAWADAYASGERDITKLQAAVDAAVLANNIDTDQYQIITTTRGVTVVEKNSVEAGGTGDPNENIITFRHVNSNWESETGDVYQAERGMTWEEWLESDYNVSSLDKKYGLIKGYNGYVVKYEIAELDSFREYLVGVGTSKTPALTDEIIENEIYIENGSTLAQ